METEPPPVPEAGLEDALPTADATPDADRPTNDAGPTDASILDAARSDASVRSVVCATSPCATALTASIDGESFCALLEDKTVACWGQNSKGELGRGEEAGFSDDATPARVVGLTDIVALEHTCAIDSAGSVWCWGTGPFLQGDTATTTEPTPVKLDLPPVEAIGVGAQTACAVVDGGVQCWGANVNGQLKAPDPSIGPTVGLLPQEVAIPPGAPAHDIVVGDASFLLRADGSLVSWGATPPVGRVTSLNPDPYPSLVSLQGVSDIAVAGDNACAVVEGIAHCWGSPIYTGTDTPLYPLPERVLPEPVLTPEPVVQIATTHTVPSDFFAGIPAMPQRACAVGVSGAVYCWGVNGSGQAGDGTLSYAHAPVEVVGLPEPAARVATTPKATCALLTSGAIRCWGDGFHGQLGRGRLGPPSVVPEEVLLP